MSSIHAQIVAAAATGDRERLARILDPILGLGDDDDDDDEHQSSHRMANASSTLVRAISLYLHDRLTALDASAPWPLAQLRRLLDIVLEQAQDVHTAASPSTLHPSAYEHGYGHEHEHERSTPSTPPRTLSQHGPLPITRSPRSRARSCAEQLTSAKEWSGLLFTHTKILEYPHATEFVKTLIHTLHVNRDSYAEILPDLKPLLARSYDVVKVDLYPRIRAAYAELRTRLDAFTPEQALAYILVQLPVHAPQRKDPDARDTNERMAEEFGRPFHGDAHHRFLRFINLVRTHFLPTEEPYYVGTPIVQSSGTGKTRMVLESRNFAPLLYLCIRSRSAQGDARAGYPLPDRGVLEYFAKPGRSLNLQVACFLASWFGHLAQNLAEIENEYTTSSPRDIDKRKFDLLASLNNLHNSKGGIRGSNPDREAFFLAVTNHASKALDAIPIAFDTQANQRIFSQLLPGPVDSLDSQLRGVLRHLRSVNPDAPEPPVLVAFDECIELSSREDDKGDTHLDCLRRAWKFIGDLRQSKPERLCFWLVLMSTSSSAAYLVDNVDAANSLRRQVSAPLPTFVAASFDVHAHGRDQVATASGVAELQHIRKYGRPLWESLESNRFWSTARHKLTGAQVFESESALHCYSVLASRLALGLVPAQASAHTMFQVQKLFVQQVVDRHMRVVTEVTPDASMRVESPSEPVLAIAASLIMLSTTLRSATQAYASRADTYRSVLNSFHKRCLLGQSVPLFKGIYGELAARLALLAAWDAAKCTRLDQAQAERQTAATALDEQGCAEVLASPERVQTILSQLAMLKAEDQARLDEHIDAVRRRISQRLKCPEIKVQAWMHFTHFDVLPISVIRISPEYLWYCWKRGVALQMAHAQHGIDGIIPVFVGDLDRRFDRPSGAGADVDATGLNDRQAARHMTFVAWEAKFRREAQPATSSERMASKLAGPPLMPVQDADGGASPLTQSALVAILLDLGTTTTFRKSQDQTPQLDCIAGTDCLRLNIRGTTEPCSYPCLDALQIRDVFGAVLDTATENALYVDTNTLHNPICNRRWHPDQQCQEDTADTADTAAAQAERMDIG